MIVFLDTDFKVHTTLADDRIEIEDTFFDNKCVNLIESYRYVPIGKTWVDKGEREFAGPMIAPWRNIRQYDGEQQQYLLDKLAAAQAALAESPTAAEIAAAIEEGVNSI